MIKQVKVEGIEEALIMYSPKTVRKAAQLSMGRAVSKARTQASRAIRDVYNIKAARVNKELNKVSIFSTGLAEISIIAKGRPIGLMNFNAKWVRNVNGRARTTTSKKSTVAKRQSSKTGVTVKIVKSHSTRLEHAFIGTGRRGEIKGAGAQHVFERIDLKDRNSPLRNRATITIASMFKRDDVMERTMNAFDESFGPEFERQLQRLWNE